METTKQLEFLKALEKSEKSAYENWNYLKEKNIPNSVTEIWKCTFRESLKKTIIHSGMTVKSGKVIYILGILLPSKIYAPKGLDLSDMEYPDDCEIIRYWSFHSLKIKEWFFLFLCNIFSFYSLYIV